MTEYEKREAAQRRYEKTLDLIIWCGFLGAIAYTIYKWF